MKRALFLSMTSHPKGDGAVLLPPVRLLREKQALEAAGWETETIEVSRLKAPPMGKIFQRALMFLESTIAIVRDIINGDKPDIIIAHDIEMLPAAVKASKSLSVPLIYDAHEHWPYLIRENSRVEAVAADLLERVLVRHVSHVVTVSESIATRFREMNVPATVFYNARPTSEILTMPRDEARRQLCYRPDDFVMGFIGNTDLLLRHDRPVDAILDAMQTLRTLGSKPINWLVAGGPDAMVVQDLASERGLGDWVRTYTSMSYDQLTPFYSALDLGLVPLSDIPIHNVSMGNKVFDYMAREIPLLVPTSATDCSKLINKELCGWAYNPTTLMPMLNVIAYDSKERRKLRGQLGHNAFLRSYCWDVQAPSFVRICESYT